MDITNPQDILARTIWGEDRSGGISNMADVACVVLNRVKKPCWWGNSIITVCLKPYQFSCWLESDPNHAKLIAVSDDDLQFMEAMGIANQAVGGTLLDTVNGATSYYAKSMKEPPKWSDALSPVYENSHHLFFIV
jgi:spore germination cell wall hydrolase CwlJ-like protein